MEAGSGPPVGTVNLMGRPRDTSPRPRSSWGVRGTRPRGPGAHGASAGHRRHAPSPTITVGRMTRTAWEAIEADLRRQDVSRAARDRDADLAALVVAEFGGVALVDLLRGSLGLPLTCVVGRDRGAVVSGRLRALGRDVLLLDDGSSVHAVSLSQLVTVRGCTERPSPETTLRGRLGFTSHLRTLAAYRLPALLHTTAGEHPGRRLTRVGEDWLHLDDGSVIVLAQLLTVTVSRRALDHP